MCAKKNDSYSIGRVNKEKKKIRIQLDMCSKKNDSYSIGRAKKMIRTFNWTCVQKRMIHIQ